MIHLIKRYLNKCTQKRDNDDNKNRKHIQILQSSMQGGENNNGKQKYINCLIKKKKIHVHQNQRHAPFRPRDVPVSADAVARGVRLKGGAVHALTLLQFYEHRGLVHANINTRAGQAQDNYLVLGGLISPLRRAHPRPYLLI